MRHHSFLGGLLAVSAVVALAGCSPQAAPADSADPSSTGQAESVAAFASFDAIPWDETSETGAKITVLDEGTKIQRTPDDTGSAYYTNPPDAPSYNMTYLNADERGCGACHSDLAELVASMQYDHIDLRSNPSMQLTVENCLACHEENYYMTTMNTFGELIHGIHGTVEEASCMTCHAVTDSYSGDQYNGFEPVTGGLHLWDMAKYSLLHGITKAESIEGAFSFDQDLVSDSLFYANWMGWSTDYDRYANEDEGVPRDEGMLRDWEINLIDSQGKTTSFTMGELMDSIESVTDVRTMHCGINVTNAGLVNNVEVTGIPLAKVLERAGYDPASIPTLKILDPAQAEANWDGYPFPYIDSEDSPDLLVYEVNGELLSWANGFPVVNGQAGSSKAGADVKQVTDIYLYDEPMDADLTGALPVLGVFDLHDGQIVNLGDTLTVEGVADAFGYPIAAMEFSLDGENWTSYPTTDAHAGNWVHWSFGWTPEEPGAYVLQVRAVDTAGTASFQPARYLINVKA